MKGGKDDTEDRKTASEAWLEEICVGSEQKLVTMAEQNLSAVPSSPLVLPSAHRQAGAQGGPWGGWSEAE